MWSISSSSVVVVRRSISQLHLLIPSAIASSATNSRFPLPRRISLAYTHTPNSNLSWIATVGENQNQNGVQSTSTSNNNISNPTSVPVRVAHELLQAGHHYLDVRTPEEYSAGHTVNSVNIPYMFKVGSGMIKNPNFVDQVLSHFRKDDEIIVGCQSGKRSFMAAIDLLSSGFTGVTDIAGGFAAWSQSELPIES